MGSHSSVSSNNRVVELTSAEHAANQLLRLQEEAPGSVIFSESYASELRRTVERIENWQLAMAAVQIPALFYLAARLMNVDSDLNFYGLHLGGIAGLREILISMLSFTGLLSSLLDTSKLNRLEVLHALNEIKYSREELSFIDLIVPEN